MVPSNHHGRATERVHPVYLMNREPVSGAFADPRSKPVDYAAGRVAITTYHRRCQLLLFCPEADINRCLKFNEKNSHRFYYIAVNTTRCFFLSKILRRQLVIT